MNFRNMICAFEVAVKKALWINMKFFSEASHLRHNMAISVTACVCMGVATVALRVSRLFLLRACPDNVSIVRYLRCDLTDYQHSKPSLIRLQLIHMSDAFLY
jgi:hypothetical protein